MSSTKNVISTFWLTVASLMLACVWLLPNHYVPWMTFHSDAWMSIVLTLVGAAILLPRLRESREWHWPSVLVAILVFIPVAQFYFGMVPFWGTAWINSLYLIGLLLALLVGTRWEKIDQGQCADFLFFAIGIAAIVSVYLQLHQILHFDSMSSWIMKSSGRRPGANLVQPNLLATLLILGLLASGWGFMRQKISVSVSILMACFLLLGVALTQSRTGWLNVFFVLITMLLWGRFRALKNVSWVAIGLALYFVICVIGLPWITDLLLFEESRNLAERFLVGSRLLAWNMFLEAIQQQPLWGFGWGQLAYAQFQVANGHPQMEGIFSQSHNLFLDLILWNGIPIGLLVTVMIVWWFTACVRRVKNHEDVILVLFILVLGIHAMLEYPLHYAFFLLPAGLIIGVLSVRLRFRPAFVARPWGSIGVFVLSIAGLSITIIDYMRVESNFYALRFEKANMSTIQTAQPPDVFVLTQLREMIRLARFEPNANLNTKELNWMRDVVQTSPSPYGLHKLAIALALNNQRGEAQLWLKRMCKTSPPQQCEDIKEAWEIQALTNLSIAAVTWPTMSPRKRNQ